MGRQHDVCQRRAAPGDGRNVDKLKNGAFERDSRRRGITPPPREDTLAVSS